MIKATSKAEPYGVEFTDGRHTAMADTSYFGIGADTGFQPHELLEAALATCMNMTARMYAVKHGVALEQIVTTVTLDKTGTEQVVYNIVIELTGNLTDVQRQAIAAAARVCPVRKILLRGAKFVEALKERE